MNLLPPPNLLDEALGLGDQPSGSPDGRIILVEDRVETSGAFVLHHLIRLSLAAACRTVIFVAFAHPFSHYDRVMRKMGYNLSIHRDNKRLHFFDMLKLKLPDGKGERNAIEDGLVEIYSKIQRAVEDNSSSEQGNSSITIVIDDVSLLEVAAYGSGDHVLDFLHYCITLISEQDCSLVIMNHEDIYSSVEAPRLLVNLEHLADIVIKTEPLATGLAADVHGQITVMRKAISRGRSYSANKVSNFHFKVKENGAEYFYPGAGSLQHQGGT